MEQIVFPIPEICEYLTAETKHDVRVTTERDEQGSKVSDFFVRADDMFSEMKWQKKLRSTPLMFWLSSHMTVWSNTSFYLAILCNLLVAAFYPFNETRPGSIMQPHNCSGVLVIIYCTLHCSPRPASVVSRLGSVARVARFRHRGSAQGRPEDVHRSDDPARHLLHRTPAHTHPARRAQCTPTVR